MYGERTDLREEDIVSLCSVISIFSVRPSNLAEIELILATTTTLGKLGFKNFQIRINERRILKAMAAYSGFPEESYDSVFITLDKMDKIGMEGVEAELLENGFDKACVDKYLELFKGLESAEDGVAYLADTLEGFLEPEIAQSLREIMDSVKATKASDFEIVFDATLVRGMSYYTGTILRSPCRNSAAAAAVVDVMTRWWASSPAMMCPPVDSPSVSNVSSCCSWREDSKCLRDRSR